MFFRLEFQFFHKLSSLTLKFLFLFSVHTLNELFYVFKTILILIQKYCDQKYFPPSLTLFKLLSVNFYYSSCKPYKQRKIYGFLRPLPPNSVLIGRDGRTDRETAAKIPITSGLEASPSGSQFFIRLTI